MPIGYPEAFGLSDNPFGPTTRVGTLPPPLTRDLQARPLLLHKNPSLETLYCQRIASFHIACQDLETTLEAGGYKANPLQRGTGSYLIALQGDRGAGKTTLASRMIQLVKTRRAEGDSAWVVTELLLDASNEAGSDQAAKIQALEKKLTDEPPEYCCILIDDLRADAYRNALQMYEKLADTIAFLFITSSDPALPAQVSATRQAVQSFRIPRLTADDALAFVNDRYRIFRTPPDRLVAAPLFPFEAEDIRTAVAAQAFDGAESEGPVTIRLIAGLLRSALHQRLIEINRSTPQFNVYALPESQLGQHVIQMAQSYRTLVYR